MPAARVYAGWTGGIVCPSQIWWDTVACDRFLSPFPRLTTVHLDQPSGKVPTSNGGRQEKHDNEDVGKEYEEMLEKKEEGGEEKRRTPEEQG